jgi:hypothetical protein
MGEVIAFKAVSRHSSTSPSLQERRMPYETYLAYRQAEEAFRALYFGRPLDLETIESRPSAKIVQRHWSTVDQLAETLLREQSLSRDQVVKLLLQASLHAPQPMAAASGEE